jgi:hypothetical protein
VLIICIYSLLEFGFYFTMPSKYCNINSANQFRRAHHIGNMHQLFITEIQFAATIFLSDCLLFYFLPTELFSIIFVILDKRSSGDNHPRSGLNHVWEFDVVLLNIRMYFAVPALVTLKLKGLFQRQGGSKISTTKILVF